MGLELFPDTAEVDHYHAEITDIQRQQGKYREKRRELGGRRIGEMKGKE